MICLDGVGCVGINGVLRNAVDSCGVLMPRGGGIESNTACDDFGSTVPHMCECPGFKQYLARLRRVRWYRLIYTKIPSKTYSLRNVHGKVLFVETCKQCLAWLLELDSVGYANTDFYARLCICVFSAMRGADASQYGNCMQYLSWIF